MLYQIYDAQRALMEPFAEFAQATAKLYAAPTSPLSTTPLAQRMAAGFELLYRLGKDYEKPSFGIQTLEIEGAEIAINERVVTDKPFCELRHFKRFTDNAATLSEMASQPVVLIVAPLSGHYATLLRDTVKSMLKSHKVFVTDWRNARLVPLEDGEFHLSDYVNYIQEFIRDLQAQYGDC
ncbi:MAG: polyhydroxyalkanoate depolymerase, partial [Burkholderiaceae bacterium]